MNIPLFMYPEKGNMSFSIELRFLVFQKIKRCSKIIKTVTNGLLLTILDISNEIDKVILNLLIHLIDYYIRGLSTN